MFPKIIGYLCLLFLKAAHSSLPSFLSGCRSSFLWIYKSSSHERNDVFDYLVGCDFSHFAACLWVSLLVFLLCVGFKCLCSQINQRFAVEHVGFRSG